MYEIPHELPINVRLRILGNKYISRKSLKYLESKPSPQLVTPKKNLDGYARKLQKVAS